jgi:hypothetical protein
LYPFAQQFDVGPGGVEPYLLTPQSDDLRDARAGVVQGQQQGMVAPAGPDCPVGCGKQGLDLVTAQIRPVRLRGTEK